MESCTSLSAERVRSLLAPLPARSRDGTAYDDRRSGGGLRGSAGNPVSSEGVPFAFRSRSRETGRIPFSCGAIPARPRRRETYRVLLSVRREPDSLGSAFRFFTRSLGIENETGSDVRFDLALASYELSNAHGARSSVQ